MGGLKESGQAVGARGASRGWPASPRRPCSTRPRGCRRRQRFFNLVVTNVPGPQFPLYLQGRRLRAFYPQVPLTLNTALGIAIMSYDGRLGFGLLGDYDALPDLDAVADDLEALDRRAGGGRPGCRGRPPAAGAGRDARRPPRRSAAAAASCCSAPCWWPAASSRCCWSFNARDDAGRRRRGEPAGPGRAAARPRLAPPRGDPARPARGARPTRRPAAPTTTGCRRARAG